MQNSLTIEKQNIFTSWVNTYADNLYTWAYHKTSDKDIAKDLVQDTFLSAYKSMENFKGESNPKTWLIRILNNKIVDFYRKKAKHLKINIPLSTLEKDETDAFFDRYQSWEINGFEAAWQQDQNLMDNTDFQNALNNCLKKLPQKWQFTISAKYLLDKNAKEICQDLDISASNYWQILHRSKLSLKKCLELNWFEKN